MGDLRHARGFTLVELLTVVAILGLLVAVALRLYQPATAKASVVDGFAGGSEARMRVHEHYATTGRWLDVGAEKRVEEDDPYPHMASIDQGAVSVAFAADHVKRLGGDTLTLRPAVRPRGEGMALVWVCGSAAIPGGLVAQGEDQTDIPVGGLPGLCR